MCSMKDVLWTRIADAFMNSLQLGSSAQDWLKIRALSLP